MIITKHLSTKATKRFKYTAYEDNRWSCLVIYGDFLYAHATQPFFPLAEWPHLPPATLSSRSRCWLWVADAFRASIFGQPILLTHRLHHTQILHGWGLNNLHALSSIVNCQWAGETMLRKSIEDALTSSIASIEWDSELSLGILRFFGTQKKLAILLGREWTFWNPH